MNFLIDLIEFLGFLLCLPGEMLMAFAEWLRAKRIAKEEWAQHLARHDRWKEQAPDSHKKRCGRCGHLRVSHYCGTGFCADCTRCVAFLDGKDPYDRAMEIIEANDPPSQGLIDLFKKSKARQEKSE